MLLEKKTALITGASRGIGKGTAIEMAKEGASVIIIYKEDLKGAEEVRDYIRKTGGFAECFKMDVSSYNECSDVLKKVIDRFGRIDILVNNAGISKTGLFIDMKEEEWNEIINVNLKGIFNVTQNVLKNMISRKSGTIINISSMWGEAGASCETIYSASKGGVNSFTKALSKELAPSNIRVNAIAPGVIDTDMNSWLSKDEREELTSEIPMERYGTIYEVGKTAVYLASDLSSYVTGKIITVDGGFI